MTESSGISRRNFLQGSTAVAGLSLFGSSLFPNGAAAGITSPAGQIKIALADANFERESLVRPFGFKGGYMTEIWHNGRAPQSFGAGCLWSARN